MSLSCGIAVAGLAVTSSGRARQRKDVGQQESAVAAFVEPFLIPRPNAALIINITTQTSNRLPQLYRVILKATWHARQRSGKVHCHL